MRGYVQKCFVQILKIFVFAKNGPLNQDFDEIKPLMGDVLGNAMPDITGPSLPLPTKPKLIP